MIAIYAILGLLLAGIGLIVAWPFLPVIQSATNATNEALTEALTTTWASGTPFEPIMHLWPIWAMLLIGVCVVIILVATARQG